MLSCSPWLLLPLLLWLSAPAGALQLIDAKDGETFLAKISQKEVTRIAIDKGRIRKVTGNAGEFVRKYFNDIGSAGGHRAMAKAVVPIAKFRAKFGDLSGHGIAARIGELAEQFLHDKQI